MATPYKDMSSDLWTYLNAQSAYSALSLNEHRGYNGLPLAFDPAEGRFPDGALPAITVDPNEVVAPQPWGGDGAAGGIENGLEDVVTLVFSVIYGTDGDTESRDTIEAAAATISDTLLGAAAVRNRLGSSTIADYSVTSQGFTAIRDRGEGGLRYWVWNFDVELTGNRRFVN